MNWNELTRSYSIWDENNIKGFFGEYRWLSNYDETPLCFDGRIYGSVEAAYQAAKIKDFNKRDHFCFMSPAEAKKEGQKVELREDWERVKIDIMRSCIWCKFSQNPKLKQKLIDTGDKHLEETNHWNDKFWGACSKTGVGENWLGKILMFNRETHQAYSKGKIWELLRKRHPNMVAASGDIGLNLAAYPLKDKLVEDE